jgi:hypothetical protein
MGFAPPARPHKQKEEAAFLKKSGAKNFCSRWARGGDTGTGQTNKKLLFVHKK